MRHSRGAEALLDAIRSCAAASGSLQGVVYRVVSRKYSTAASAFSGEGAYRAGGRWNPPASFHAVYCSSTPELALAEFLGGARSSGFAPETFHPYVGHAARVRVERVLDLRSPVDGAWHATELRRMIEADWLTLQDRREEAATQAIGRVAAQVGVQAILAASNHARSDSEFNVVIVRENLDRDSSCVVRGGRQSARTQTRKNAR